MYIQINTKNNNNNQKYLGAVLYLLYKYITNITVTKIAYSNCLLIRSNKSNSSITKARKIIFKTFY